MNQVKQLVFFFLGLSVMFTAIKKQEGAMSVLVILSVVLFFIWLFEES